MRSILQLVLVVVCAFADAAGDAAKEIERALANPKATESTAAIVKHGALGDARVVAALAKGLADKRAEVRGAVVDTLGLNAHADALATLERFHKAENKALRKDAALYARVLIAVARHGKSSSIALLGEGAEAVLDAKVIEARVLGLANVRDKASVGALFALADRIGFLESNTHAETFRLALVVLTGQDNGRALDAWRVWWRDAAKEFVVPAELPKLAKSDAEKWRAFWAGAK